MAAVKRFRAATLPPARHERYQSLSQQKVGNDGNCLEGVAVVTVACVTATHPAVGQRQLAQKLRHQSHVG